MRKLASIRRILDLNPIQGADKIEVARIDGWEVVVKKEEFKVGDLCVYFEIDSILPEHAVFEFMRKAKFRVRTIKLKGQVSQGLALKTDILKSFDKDHKRFHEGHDVTDIIGVKKHDPEAEKERKVNYKKLPKWKSLLYRIPLIRRIFIKKDGKYPFPTHIVKKTDEERVQNLSPFEKRFLHNKIMCITEKIDGTSTTYIFRPGIFKDEFMVCSRNLMMFKDNNSWWWKPVQKYDIKNQMKKLYKELHLKHDEYLIIQGETIGKDIQQNKYHIMGYDFFVFNICVSNKMYREVYSFEVLKSICKKMNLKHVPFLEYYTISESLGCGTDFVDYFVEYSKGSSVLHPVEREGVVIRLSDNSVSFKAINPNFLIKFDN